MYLQSGTKFEKININGDNKSLYDTDHRQSKKVIPNKWINTQYSINQQNKTLHEGKRSTTIKDLFFISGNKKAQAAILVLFFNQGTIFFWTLLFLL